MTAKIITTDTPNSNGRVYSKEVIQKAFDKYKEDFVNKGRALIFHRNSPNLEESYGIVKDIFLNENEGYIEFQPLESIKGNEVFTDWLEQGKIYVTIAGTGKVIDNKVEDYTLEYIFLDPNPSWK